MISSYIVISIQEKKKKNNENNNFYQVVNIFRYLNICYLFSNYLNNNNYQIDCRRRRITKV